MNEITLSIILLIFSWLLSGALMDLAFGKEEKVEVLPYPPNPSKKAELLYTTDIIPTKDTTWMTHDEFFGKEDETPKGKGRIGGVK